MNISIIFGRGIEGAGVTRYVIELVHALEQQGHSYTVYDLDDRKFLRAGKQALVSKSVIPAELLTLHKTINETDLLLVASVPSTKHLPESQENFLRLLENVTVKRALVQIDHKMESMRRNANWHEVCALCDKIITFGMDTPFYRDLVQKKGRDQLQKFVRAQVLYSPDKLEKFRVPFSERTRRVLYLGRFATWKDPQRLQLLLTHTDNRQNKFLVEMLGVERSLAFGQFVYYTDYEKRIKNPLIEWKWKLNAKYEELVPPSFDYVRCWGVYEYEFGMRYLASSLFSASFYHHKLDDAFADHTEYAMLEMMSSGTVPLFDPNWARVCHPWRNGKRDVKSFAEQDMFALFLRKDGQNTGTVVQDMLELSQDERLYTQVAESAQQLAREISDPKWIVPKLLEDIFKPVTDEYTEKMKADKDIKNFFQFK